MNSTLIQHWQFSYVCVALLVAVGATAVADHLRSGNPPVLVVRYGLAGLVGLGWPVAIVAVIQFWVIAVLAHRFSPAPATAARTGTAPAARFMLAAGSH